MQGIDPKPKAVWSCTFSGHISEGWQGFSQGINQKPEAIWSQRFFGTHLRRLVGLFAGHRPKAEGSLELYFFGLSQRVAWGASRSVGKGSRRLSGRNVFSGYISKGWSGFSQGIDPKPKAVWSCTFSGYRSGSLGEPRGWWEKAAGGCLAETSFWGTFPDAGETFCRELTKSRKLSGGNIFSGYISKGWSGFSQRISPKLEAAWPERLFRAQFRRLVGLFAGYRPKAEGCLKLHFFGLSQRAA
ncbi:hypothetical protein T231_13345 [Tannerella sp. oral taxon BU063 isolate Cell 6/7/9]|uniref:Uncharacterized protein n=1 Tax=Tannerella sp. oral taxon BU063 isolate Cell 6/7/9 TaxID=1411021 RepID=W2CM79_9BACT|nr:hypothetical protein T231_13345 [Tannerella sp. oral taxon BU063 isolate Cell 6/7/9]